MNKRQVLLLEYLMKNIEYLSANQLADRYKVSTKTVYQDIDKINDFLKDNSIETEIIKIPRKGIKLLSELENKKIHTKIMKLNVEMTESFSPEYREKELIRKLFINHEKVDLYEFSEEMYVTDSTIHRLLDKLNGVFTPFDVKLKVKKDEIILKGNERNIRKALEIFIVNFLSMDRNRMKNLELFFSKEDIKDCQKAIIKLSDKYQFHFTDEYSFSLLLDCLIFKKRNESNEILTNRFSNLVNDVNHLEVYFFAGELLETILNFPLEKISPYEIEAMAYNLLAFGFNIQSVEYMKNVNEQVKTLIQKVSNLLSLNLTTDDHLQMMLSAHISKMIIRLRNQNYISNPALEEIKKQYSSLFNVIWLSIRTLSKYYELSIPNEELAFIVIHFQVAIEKIMKPLNIVVICQNGIATSELIMNKLRRIFSSNEKLTTIGLRELDFYDLKNIDLVISTIGLPELNIPVIEVSPIITKEELGMIQQFYAEQSTDNYRMVKTSLNGREFNVASLNTLLKKPNLIKINVKNKQECIERLMFECSIGNQTEEFRDSINQRELLGSTSVYTGIALPHCDPKVVKQSELILMSLDKPIEWGKNLVSLVLLIAIAEQDISVFKDSLIALYSVIENQNLMSELMLMSDGEKIKSKILEEVSQNAR